MSDGTSSGDKPIKGKLELPAQFGADISDTSRGNGSFVDDPDVLARFRDQHIEHQRELKKARVEAFNEGMLSNLERAAKFHGDILAAGAELAERAASGMILSQQERELMKMAANSAKEIVDRSIGKSVTKHEETKQVSILGLMLDARKQIDGR